MDRREFVRVALTAGTMSVGSWTAYAADSEREFGLAKTAIIAQRGVPHTAELADRLWFGLVHTGLSSVMRRERSLENYEDITELLSCRPHSWLIAITRDATAVLAQAIAATGGSACVLHVQHRVTPKVVRHSCTSSTTSEMFSWSERRAFHDTRLGAIYASMLGADPLPQDESRAALPNHVSTSEPSTSLASFLIRL